MIIAKTIYIFAIYKFGSRLIIIVIRVYGGAFLLCNDIESIVASISIGDLLYNEIVSVSTKNALSILVSCIDNTGFTVAKVETTYFPMT